MLFRSLWQRTYSSERWFSSLLQTYWKDQPGYSGLLSEEEINIVKTEEGLSEDYLKREYGCSFSTGLQGAYYTDHIEKAYENKRISEYAYDDTLKVDTFWDLGVDDSTAVWFRQKINNKIIFIDYYEDSGKDLQFYVRMLENKGYNYGTHYLPHDSGHRSIQSGSSTADLFEELLRANSISDNVVVLERLPVQDGINSVRARLSRYHFDVTNCLEGIKKIELYHRRWDKRRSVFMQDPFHDLNSHAADALRMEAISEDIRNDHFYNKNEIEIIHQYDIFDI